MKTTVALVFSMNRALQLDACLRSLARHCTDHGQCHKRVVFRCSNDRHAAQYRTLQTEHPDVEFVAESDFCCDLLSAIEGFEQVMFLVDDNVFIRPFRLQDVTAALQASPSAIGFSLRLGRNISRCYPLGDAAQHLPPSEKIAPGILKYSWTEAIHDFGYPLEVSSSVYRMSDIGPMIARMPGVRNPNQLEELLVAGKPQFGDSHPHLLCFEHSVAFCNPVNVVQTSLPNRAGRDEATSVRSLMERFDLGYRVDVGAFDSFTPSGPHEEMPFTYLPPQAGWDGVEASLTLSPSAAMPLLTLQDTIHAREMPEEELHAALWTLKALRHVGATCGKSWLAALGAYFLGQRREVASDASRLQEDNDELRRRIDLLNEQYRGWRDQAERKTRALWTLAHQMGYSSEQPSSPKKQILGLKKENARLRENCKHLEGLVESARRWQSRSWIKRAFHKWRPSKRALKKPHAQGEPVAAESLAASPSPDEVSPGNGQQRAQN